VQRLSQEDGVNLAGIKRIIDLESRVEALQTRVHELLEELAVSESRRIHAETTVQAMSATYGRELVPQGRSSSALVVWRPRADR
jgi:MerR family transcriptional regulator/heat shock protein HspR